jgi:MFS transporter, ACS family, tartrate transporter
MKEDSTSLEQHTMRKVTMRIIPFAFLMYIITYLERVNLSYAALQMNKDLALSGEAFGFASGIFFIGYFIFEIPSNILMQKFGAKIWIARILISMGIASILTGFAQNAIQLYIFRFLLGLTEAGFFPGIILYFTYWFRAKERATTTALFVAAMPLAMFLGGPINTLILDHVHYLGLPGWRWMLILGGGVPSIIGGIITYFYWTSVPEEAKWLSGEEKKWLIAELKQENEARKNIKNLSTLKAIFDPKVLYLAVVFFLDLTGTLGIVFWMPQIIKGFSAMLTNTQIGLITMIPYLVASIIMIYWSRRSDRKGERRLHAAIPILVSAIGLVGAVMTTNPVVAITFITIALSGIYSFKAPFFALPTLFLSQSTFAVSFATINSVGNLGGFAGPYAIGLIKDSFGMKASLLFLSGLLLIAFFMVLFIRLDRERAVKAGCSPAGPKQLS